MAERLELGEVGDALGEVEPAAAAAIVVVEVGRGHEYGLRCLVAYFSSVRLVNGWLSKAQPAQWDQLEHQLLKNQ